MPRLVRKPPAYKLHKPSGQARLRVDGRDHYLGPFGSPESHAEYDRLIAEWLSGGRSLARAARGEPGLTVTELIARYWRFAEHHYQHEGRPTRELENIKISLRPLRKLYGHTPAGDFGPAAYRAIRQAMIDAGLCRRTINFRLGKIRRLFRWAVEHEHVPADVHQRLQAVAPLRAGRDGVREREPVGPVPEEHVEAVLPLVRPAIRAMIQLQALTGMRPGEVLRMTTGEIDRSGEVWIYRPRRHKTAGLGRVREVLLCPQAQTLLATWLQADPAAPLFSPRASEDERREQQRRNRKTPLTPSQRARKRKARPKRSPRGFYDKNSYCGAIHRACRSAGIPVWGPNRLRHLAASKIRKAFGLEAAQVILGHARADVTQVYAQRNLDLARQAVKAVG